MGTSARRRGVLVAVLTAAVLGAGCDPPSDQDDGSPAQARADEVTTLTEVPPLHPSVDGYPEAWVTLDRERGDPVVLPVKLADTPERRQHGLMEVAELPDGTGMLFVFDEEREGGFWMKDTLVPLDIAFVGEDGAIVRILEMEPCEADPCEVYDPGVAYRQALEVPAGWFASQGVEVGDGMRYETEDERRGSDA